MADIENSSMPPMPTGDAYIQARLRRELESVEATTQFIAKAGDKAPRLYESLGDTFATLDGLGSCYWGCKGGDHGVEYLVGRGCSAACAAHLLLRSAYYDEALALVRSVGEIVNLLFLFRRTSTALSDWSTLPEKQRRERYSPIRVRLAIEALGSPVPVDEHRYSELSRRSVHVTPTNSPQKYNPIGIPTLGAFFQPPGVLVVLNELAHVSALLLLGAVALIEPPEPARERMLDVAERLYDSIGHLDVRSVDSVLTAIKKKNHASDDPPPAV